MGVVVEGKGNKGNGVGVAVEGKSVGLLAERYRMVAVPVGRGLAEEGAEERHDHDFVFRCQLLPSLWEKNGREKRQKQEQKKSKKGVAQSGAHTGARTSISVTNKL